MSIEDLKKGRVGVEPTEYHPHGMGNGEKDNAKADSVTVQPGDLVIGPEGYLVPVGLRDAEQVTAMLNVTRPIAYSSEPLETKPPGAVFSNAELIEQGFIIGTPIPPKPESVLQEADRLVSTDRGSTYGHPLDDFSKVTGMAKALWGRGPESAEEHSLYLVLVKLARLQATPGHHDSIVDAAGYLKTYAMVIEERVKRITDKG